jgi:lauroyl/myristoyl acyltransferase
MASAHAGISVVHHAGLYPALPFPVSVIAQQTAPAGRAGDFNISTKDASANLEFMKLAKMMRKSPRLVRIFPDGPDGEGLPVSVFGRPGRIGRGAAMLSYLGKAATYFAEAHWTGDGFAFSLRAGPLATDYSDLASFERSFADFYVSCFERIVRGAPEDMMPNGGLWPVVLS